MTAPYPKSELINASEFARRVDKNVDRIRRWKSAGKLPCRVDGLFTWPECRTILEALEAENPRRYSKRVAHPPAPNAPRLKDLATKDVSIDHDSPREEEPDPDAPAAQAELDREQIAINLSIGEKIIIELQKRIKGADGLAYQWARSLNECAKSRKLLLDLQEQEGKTLPRNEVESWVYQRAKQNRDQWLNWPQMVSIEVAEELGVDSKLMHDVLLKHVRNNLSFTVFPETYDKADLEEQQLAEVAEGGNSL